MILLDNFQNLNIAQFLLENYLEIINHADVFITYTYFIFEKFYSKYIFKI